MRHVRRYFRFALAEVEDTRAYGDAFEAAFFGVLLLAVLPACALALTGAALWGLLELDWLGKAVAAAVAAACWAAWHLAEGATRPDRERSRR